MLECSALPTTVPIAISYRPKANDYLPVVVAAIRRFLGDWPIVLLTQARHLPPPAWLEAWHVDTITDWAHSDNANKVLRLWEHQEIFAAHFERWIWWHDDMLLLRPVADPPAEFSAPRVRHLARTRPNKKLSNWHVWLWDTLGFFESLSMPSHNPVCHIPRLIDRKVLQSVPREWNRQRLLFEPTYLLWHWHHSGAEVELADGFRTCIFQGEMPALDTVARSGATLLNWGRRIDHASAQESFATHYPLCFDGRPG
tara:strand:+ start:28816 stop:29580 length:765 start_codon:yes stop_codon:yes gene_type:complete